MSRKHSRRQFLKVAGTSAAAASGVGAFPAIGRAAAPFFKLYLMIPNNQPARMAWGTLAANQMTKLGIDVVSSFVPFSAILPRRSKGDGATHVNGGWDAYLERYYYNAITPMPNNLFRSTAAPPSGQNFYYLNDPQIDKALDDYAAARDEAGRMEAIHRFEKRWYDTQPMTILFYPKDVLAMYPKLKGYDATTFNPVFFPDPENWTIEGAGDNATAAFASWEPPTSLLPMYSAGYHESNIFGPVYNCLFEYDSWKDKRVVPALAESATPSDGDKHWVVKLRQGVTWHSGEEFTAEDVKFTWDTMLEAAYASVYRAVLLRIFGSREAYKVTGKHEITVSLPAYTIEFASWLLPTIQIMPAHAYRDIKPEAMRGHVANTFRGTFTVKTSDGKSFTANGGVGTGPWVAAGFDPARKAYKYAKNTRYWKKTPGNVSTFYIVNIQGTDSVLSALKAGEIDAHDPMYDIGSLVSTIDPSWGRVSAYDSYKWQHICYNLRHPVIGTGVDTPLGQADPARAAEAAAYIRQAISFAIPREQIVKEIAGGYGEPGTVPMAFTSPEYDHAALKPIPYDMDLARQTMEKAGYKY